jgi:hypothetical protein
VSAKHEFGYAPKWAEKMGFPKLSHPTHPMNNGLLHDYLDRTFRFSVGEQLWKVVPMTRHTPNCADPYTDHDGYCRPADPEPTDRYPTVGQEKWIADAKALLADLEKTELALRREMDAVTAPQRVRIEHLYSKRLEILDSAKNRGIDPGQIGL